MKPYDPTTSRELCQRAIGDGHSHADFLRYHSPPRMLELAKRVELLQALEHEVRHYEATGEDTVGVVRMIDRLEAHRAAHRETER